MKHVLNGRGIVRGMLLVGIVGMSYFHPLGGSVEGQDMARHPMPMLEPVTESFAAQAAPLPRTGWTATASDQQSYNPVSYVLDGNTSTFWHSQFSPTLRPLPHSLTIDMQTTHTISEFRYLPRQDPSYNGNIGQFSLSVSTDGTNWGSPIASGTWADNKTEKSVIFPAVTARYVRLTGNTEAGSRGPWSSAAEINIVAAGSTPPPGTGAGGMWGTPISFPLVPVSVAVLPNNKLLAFSAYSTIQYNKTTTVTQTALLDLNTSTVSPATTINTHHQMFCIGLSTLADGRILIDGGSTDRATTLYNATTNTWIAGPLLNIPRAYQGDTLLSTGQVFTLGGSWYDSAGGKNGEVFTPSGTTGLWTLLPNVTATNILTGDPDGVYRADNHAWLFAVSNGGVFHAGPSKRMNWITTSGLGSIRSAGTRADSADAMNGNAIMYDVGQILTLGGATAYEDAPATKRAYKINITGGPNNPVVVTRVSDMSYARSYSNSVVLPDGKVLVVGGQSTPKPFTDTNAVRSPELWDPATGRFTVMAADTIPRTYHSVAVLLPNGRVFSGGGGLCGSCTVNHLDGRIFTPPYLLNSDGTPKSRPAITSAPARAAPGAIITVQTNLATPKFALVRASATTHALNNDQRRIPLTPATTSGTTYTLRIPSDRGIVLPGTYMLFALDANGTPSVARFININ